MREVVDPYLRDDIGICQMPCPEQLAWGGVLKRHLLRLYGRPWLGPVIRPLRPALTAYTALRYWLLARRVAGQIADYQKSGFEVAGVVGVDASPTCGVATTLDLDASLGAILGCPLNRLDRSFMNDTGSAARPGPAKVSSSERSATPWLAGVARCRCSGTTCGPKSRAPRCRPARFRPGWPAVRERSGLPRWLSPRLARCSGAGWATPWSCEANGSGGGLPGAS